MRVICKFEELPEAAGNSIPTYLRLRLGERANEHTMSRLVDVFRHSLRVHMARHSVVIEGNQFWGPETASPELVSQSLAEFDLDAMLIQHEGILW
ncbi:hypothetical protein AB0A98_28390 [Streptomyces chrestomyceticus]|uniref:hypothetical protein n=1 Tax=Streptomyces chrestomyceticus TaxID=68185 RepID=UPI00340DB06A